MKRIKQWWQRFWSGQCTACGTKLESHPSYMRQLKAKHIAALILLLAAPLSATRHKRIRVPEYRAFPPSRQSLLEQNAEIDRWQLPRIKNDNELRELISDGELVQIQKNVELHSEIPARRNYLRPWAADFLQNLAHDFFVTFHAPLQVNSAVRPVTTQRWLRRWNHNAAPYKGECASAHLTGIAIDLERRRLTFVQKRWLQWRLLFYYASDAIIVEEELRQPCFHVVVRKQPCDIVPILSTLPDALSESGQ